MSKVNLLLHGYCTGTGFIVCQLKKRVLKERSPAEHVIIKHNALKMTLAGVMAGLTAMHCDGEVPVLGMTRVYKPAAGMDRCDERVR